MPEFAGVAILVSGHGLDELMWQFELHRGAQAEGGVAPLAVVEVLEVVEDRVGSTQCSDCILPQKASTIALL